MKFLFGVSRYEQIWSTVRKSEKFKVLGAQTMRTVCLFDIDRD